MLGVLRGLAFATLALPAYAERIDATLPAGVEQALKSNKLGADTLSVVMLPLNGEGAATLVNADVSVNPASTMKLVTTYAALELLGPNHQWKTEFFTDGTLKDGVLQGNLYLKGGGDPKLNMEKLWLLLRDLRANGVVQVKGDLVLDRSHFIQPDLPAFDDDGGDQNRPFLVEPDSLLVNLKALRFVTRNDGGKVSVAVEPPLDRVRIDNRVQALPAAKCPGWPDLHYNPIADSQGVTVVITGKLHAGCNGQTYLALLDHPDYAAGTVRSLWKELGGSITGGDRVGSVPSDARLLAHALSPDLTEIIRDINKYSNNTMARQLFLSLGAAHRLPGDADDAQAAQRVIRQWLASKGIAAPNLVMENGSGLSRQERITAREMAAMLQAAWRSPYAAEFISSMPLAAMDGTMRKRLRETPVAGNAHIKTGTLKDVRAIAGYSRDAQGNSWAVVAILNHPQPWGAAAILDEVLVSLSSQQGGSQTARR
ncbi:D-alanyl-D-alanine carboxypeptidase/D-alanyl-D-alanine endopeptidase [Stutzerimonas tarimensis]|uniref:D-alanyl-D-alanine carboxypeptidase/D-alanyl-D-alanine-endopeptidase n=1 Tax=Stutzerimonas tarimensis TaxID=1507735 RepID=A0ABV7T2D4_9GAMM